MSGIRHPPSLARWGAIVDVLEDYRARMAEADALASTDIRAAVELAAIAAGRLNDAMGVGKAPLLSVRTMIADLRRGKAQSWVKPDNTGGTRLLDDQERSCRAKAVALLAVLQEEDGLTKREAARRIAAVLPRCTPPVTAATIENWADELHRWLYDGHPEYFPSLVEITRRMATETALEMIAEEFAKAR
jgi:hypothetical protein